MGNAINRKCFGMETKYFLLYRKLEWITLDVDFDINTAISTVVKLYRTSQNAPIGSLLNKPDDMPTTGEMLIIWVPYDTNPLIMWGTQIICGRNVNRTYAYIRSKSHDGFTPWQTII